MLKLTPAAIALVMALGAVRTAAAQSDPIFDANGLQPHREYFSQLPFEHIDPVSGALVLSFTDLVLPGNAGRDLVFQRTYNSKGQFGGAPGKWSFGIAGLPLRIEDTWPSTPEANPVLRMADGGGALAASPVYATQRDIMMTDRFWKYYRNSRIVWLPDGSVANFDANLRLSSLVDALGNTVLTIDYHTPETATVTQHLGNAQTREIFIAFPAGCYMANPGCMPTSMVYRVDPGSEQSWRTWDYGTGDGIFLAEVQPPVGPPWRYEYAGGDGSPRTFKTITPHGGSVLYTIESVGFPWIDGETQFTNVVTSRETTDVRGGQSAGTWTFEYDWDSFDTAKASTIIAPAGVRTRHEYDFWPGLIDNNGNPFYWGRLYLVTTRKVWQGQTEPACEQAAECETREYGWFPIPGAGSTTLPALTSRTITRAGRTHTTTYGYSGQNYGDFHQPNSIVENDAGGTGLRKRTTTRTFAHSDNAPYSAPYIVGLLTSETVEEPGAAGHTAMAASWTYDAATGFNTSQTRAGITTTFTPDASGNVASVIKANGKATSYAYSWGQVREIVTPEHTTTAIINTDGTVATESIGRYSSTYLYDALGRLTRERPAGYPTASSEVITTYDDLAGATVTVQRGTSHTVTTLDGFGRPIEATSSLGVRTRTRYDALGRVVFQGYPVDIADPDIGTTIEYLDPFGGETKRINPDGTFRQRSYGAGTVTTTDENGHTTVETLEAFGSPDDARTVAILDADAKTWDYRYNVAGQMIEAEAPDDVTRSWTYNANLLLEREVHPESGATSFTYSAGVLATRTDANGTVTTFTYDGNDRVKTATAGSVQTVVTYESSTDNRAWTSNGTVATTFVYDDAGRLQRRQDAIDGKLFNTQFEYTTEDALKAIVYPSGRRIEYQHDAAGRITRVSEPAAGRDYAFGLTYHPSGALRTYTGGNLIQTTIGFDQHRYWVRSITAGALQLTYDNYDNVGNVGTIGDARFGTQTFTYDALDRLATATGAYGSSTFTYDAHGNRQGSAYQYEAGSLRLTNQSGTAFTYENNGNMRTAGSATYTYSPQNMLASAAVIGGTATYVYDADLQRIKKSFEGSTTYFVRGLGGELLSEWKDPGLASGAVRDFIYAGSRLVSAVEKATSVDPNTICGVIQPDGDSIELAIASGQAACVRFPANAARRYAVVAEKVAGASGCLYWPLGVYKPDGVSFWGTESCSSTVVLETPAVIEPGSYAIVVDPAQTVAGTVRLTLHDVDDDFIGTIVADGPTTTVSLTVAQKARVSFTAVAGRRYALVAERTTGGGGCFFWPLRFDKPDGTSFLSTDSCSSTVVVETPVVTEAGTYTILLDPAQAVTGTVRLTLHDVDDDFIGTIVADGPTTTVSLTVAQKARVSFTAVAGRRYALVAERTTGGGGCFFWPLRFDKPDGTSFWGTDSCSNTVVLETPVVTEPGTYTILVDPAQAVTGTVRLTLHDVDDIVTGTLVVNDPAAPVSLTTAQVARLTFTGTGGQQVTVRLTANTMGYTTVKLLRPDGSTLTSNGSSASSFNLTAQTVSSSGEYTVLIDPSGSNTGSISVRVTNP